MFLYTCRENRETYMSQQAVNGLNIPSIQNKRPVTFQQNATPPMQGATADQVRQSARETADNNYLANRAKASKDTNPFALLGLGAAIWYGIGQMMEKINPHFGGDYEKSIGGRVGRFGDRISNTWLGKKIGSLLDSFSKKLDVWEKNSKIIYTLRHHSTSPEWAFAKMPGKGLEGFLSADAEQVVEEFMKPIGSKAQKLEQYGLSQAKIDTLVRNISGKPKYLQDIIIQKAELAQMGADSKIVEKILKQRGLAGLQKYAEYMKVQALGFGSLKEFHKLKGKFVDNPDRALKLFEDMAKKHPDWKISIWRNKKGFLGRFRSHLLGRQVSFSEYRNKYLIATGKGAESRLGKALTKALGWITEGGTNRFAGGKLVVAMQAGIFADMLLHTFNAPKGEKIKTFAERLVNDFTYFIGLTLGIIGMHKLGGFMFAGLDNAGKAKYLKALEKFNKNVDAGKYANKKAYNRAFKALNDKLGVKNIKNPITRVLNWGARILNLGNYRRHAYKSNAKWNLNWLRKMANGNLLGVPIRILIPLAVVTPFLVKLTTSTAHKIFGRPTNSVLDEDKEDVARPEGETRAQQIEAARQISKAQDTNVTPGKNPTNMGRQPKNPQEYQSDSNLIKMRANGQPMPESLSNSQAKTPTSEAAAKAANSAKDGERYIPSPYSEIGKNSTSVVNNSTTIINSSDNAKKEYEPVRTYIPSPVGMVPQGPDMTAADKAMADADNAEKFINETLAQLKM